MSTLAEVRKAAMELSEEERQVLAWDLMDSVQKEPGYDASWAAEISRRIDEIDSGKVRMIPHEEVMAELREMRRAYPD